MQQIGIIGMAVMGKNLALNIKNHGYSVSVYSVSTAETKKVANKYADDALLPTYSWVDFVASLERPRKIIMMIKAGKPVDDTIDRLKALLNKGDILIDGGNSYFDDTNRRVKSLNLIGIHYLGLGVSGGELGALKGPSMMPGGAKSAYQEIAPILEKIAAKTPEGIPCVAYMGPAGAGHYVKMVHNGIEYGIMQSICEIYDLIRKIMSLNNIQIADYFEDWNNGELEAYLVEITGEVLRQKDSKTGKDLVDVILNQASYKGTGNWMIEDAIKLGAPISVIASAVFARFMSDRVISGTSPIINEKKVINTNLTGIFKQALYLTQAVSYAQGFQQMKLASETYQWNLNFSSIASVWEAGCIIRSKTLVDIRHAFDLDDQIENLFQADFFKNMLRTNIDALRQTVSLAGEYGIPVPALSSALSYLESLFNQSLPANLLQAQRDYFGAHTYKRVDEPGIFHTEWYTEA